MKAKKVNERELSQNELAFIKKYGISVDEIIDVTGMIPIGQRRAMEAHKARLKINGGNCVMNHRLRTRSNHCPVCEPKNLAFEKRHSELAFVYICKSATGLIKIGYAKDPSDRANRLNREAFASCGTWRLIFKVETEKAGKVEALAQGYLSRSLTAEPYDKGGREVVAREVFLCSEEDAKAAVERALKQLRLC